MVAERKPGRRRKTVSNTGLNAAGRRRKTVSNTGLITLRLHLDLLEEFRAACFRELGPMRSATGSAARALVIERLMRQYIDEQCTAWVAAAGSTPSVVTE